MCKKLLNFVLMFGFVSTAIGQPAGEILFEYWFDIDGVQVADLTGQSDYPDNPDNSEMRSALKGRIDWADNYGTRVRGWLYPPKDGDYTFWISGDDYQDLYLSTNDDPANAAVIAQVPGWTPYLQWDKYPEQQSEPVTLAAGGKYYIEVLMKEGGGGDNLTVGWTGPGIGDEITVIDGAYLSPAEPSIVQQTILIGEQTLNYDNSVYPYVSELVLDTPADLTDGGIVSDLTLRYQGQAANLNFEEETGTYTITGEGADVWGSSDQFHYVYMQLTGDGEISARVVSNGTGSNTWAKGGVMIRESIAPDSKHMIMCMTGGNGGGIAFQGRAETGGNSSSYHGDVITKPPYWVKLVREGNKISGYHSADGVNWQLMTDTSPDDSGRFGISNPQSIEMPGTVLIGLFVTSHADGENRTYVFDNMDVQGDADGVIVSEDIDSVSGNSAESIYVVLEDNTGAVAMITHPNPEATMIGSWRNWIIPLGAFTGVDPTAATTLIVGVGDREPGGSGAITVADIRVFEAIPSSIDITHPGDIVKGVPDDGDWPEGEAPPLAIDDNVGTKYLHFKGGEDPMNPVGIRVTPSVGPTIVTELTFTTANDAPARDPISFELYGSNESIDGPYELIAAGDIVDFAGEDAWPRFTKNQTAIVFDNDKAYVHYQLVFPVVRDPSSANTFQIAEVEIIGTVPGVQRATLDIWVEKADSPHDPIENANISLVQVVSGSEVPHQLYGLFTDDDGFCRTIQPFLEETYTITVKKDGFEERSKTIYIGQGHLDVEFKLDLLESSYQPTEEFLGDDDSDGFDLAYSSVTFTPTSDGTSYTVSHNGGLIQLITDPSGGIDLGLTDDNFSHVQLSNQKQVRLFGQSFSDFYVGCNGYITFEQGDGDHSQSLTDHFNMWRISGLYCDLKAANEGKITSKQLSESVVITWQGVPEYSNTAPNTFQIEMFFDDGIIRLSWLEINADEGIVGLSKGSGLPEDFVETDFSDL